jgi:hypothetical protein
MGRKQLGVTDAQLKNSAEPKEKENENGPNQLNMEGSF